jgi:2-methylfumaryl-CoA isomerase
MYRLLAGLRVIELPAFIAAPLCGNTLAQFGAEVIRIDPIGGGLDQARSPLNSSGQSLYWAGLNYAKRSVCLDLTSDEGRRLVRALIAAPHPGGGIVSSNLTYGWLAYEKLRELRPDLIMLSIEGHVDGRSAVDYTVNAETGLPFLTGPADTSNPVNHVLPAWDIATGLYGALALVSAERQRKLSGEGCEIRLSLADIAYALLATLGFTSELEVTGHERVADGNSIYGSFGRDFATADGRKVMIVAITDGQWKRLLDVTELSETMDAAARSHGLNFNIEQDRYAGRDAIAASLEKWVGGHTLAEVENRFAGTGICWGSFRSLSEVVKSDQRFATGLNPVFVRRQHEGYGTFTLPGAAVRLGNQEREPLPEAPTLGKDTGFVLKTMLGLSNDTIRDLQARGIAGGMPLDG